MMLRKLILLTLLVCPPLMATELVYQPVNPSFGGSPLNGGYLLSNAQAQNGYEADSSSRSFSRPSALERFTSSLQSRLLSQLLSDIDDGKTGSLQTDQFSIFLEDDGAGGLTININDLLTGESTTVSVNGLVPNE